MKMTVESITPEIAKRYLEHNQTNRSISKNRVTAYARDMLQGAWQLNGEAIIFDEDGNLKNGQHRLTAVVKSGATIQFLVVRGIERDVNVIDRGRPRTSRDVLLLDGYDSSLVKNYIVAACKNFAQIKYKMTVPTDSDIATCINFFHDEIEMYNTFQNDKGVKYSKRAGVALALLTAMKCGVSPDICRRFVEVLNTGRYSGDKESSAITLREDFTTRKLNSRGGVRTTGGAEWALYPTEKAIFDFANGTSRKKSYCGWTSPIFICNHVFEDVLEK